MSQDQSDQTAGPTGRQSRDARRHAHGVQKNSRPEAGGDKKDRKGKGDPKP